jgi:hypothetical protein
MNDIDMDLTKKQGDDVAEEFHKEEPTKPFWHKEEDKEENKADTAAEGFFGSMHKDDEDLEKPSFLRRLGRRKNAKKDEEKTEKTEDKDA